MSSIPPSPNHPGTKALSWIPPLLRPFQTIPVVSLAAAFGLVAAETKDPPSSCVFLLPVPAPSWAAQPLSACQAPASAAAWIYLTRKLVRLFVLLNCFLHVQAGTKWARGKTAGETWLEWGRWRWRRWRNTFPTGPPTFFCHAEPPGSALPTLPGNSMDWETHFPGMEEPGGTWDWKLMHLRATYSFIITVLLIVLGTNFW